MDKSQLSNEEIFKLEANEVAKQMGVEEPFDEDGNVQNVSKKEYKDMSKKELLAEFVERFGKDSSKGLSKDELVEALETSNEEEAEGPEVE